MVHSAAKQLFYFSQFFKVKLGEGLYRYDKEKEFLPFLRSVVALLVLSTRDWFSMQNSSDATPLHAKHIVYIDTLNQRNALNALMDRLNKSEVQVIVYEGLSRTPFGFPGMSNLCMPLRKLYGLALLLLFQSYFLAKPLLKKFAGRVNSSHVYFNLALFRAAVIIFDQYIKRLKPTTITVVNDHNLFPLALLYSAKRNGVTSVYIQHAAVSEVFPKLLVDVALLEGRHALDIYDRIGNYSRTVKLVGIPRLDGFIGFRNSWKKAGLIVGVCLKAYYPSALIEGLIKGIRQSSSVSKIVLRPHPGSSISFWNQVEMLQLSVSDSRTENSVAFLKTVDIVISGESTILLEAALGKIPTIYFDDKMVPFDLCGYSRNGIITSVIGGFEEIAGAIEKITESEIQRCFDNCKYYCDTLGTTKENKSVESLVNFYEIER
jgi:hypothetical protein